MRWPPLFSIFAALLICGCGGQRVGFDPFGRTTIPPPPTAMRSSGADPYYSGVTSPAAPPLVSLPQGSIASAPASLSAGSLMARSASSINGWRAAGANAAETAVAASPPPGRLRPVPTYLDNNNNSDATNITLTAGNPDAWNANDNSTAEFQEAAGNRFSTANSSSNSSSIEHSVRYAGGITATTLPQREIDTSSGPFGHASDYTWLKGRLEYSASQRQWKLRYIPVDEEPDAFGGHVVLPALSELENYRSGDSVIVHGRLAEKRLEGRQYEQAFDVARLERQR